MFRKSIVKKRIFIAIDVSNEVKSEVADYINLLMREFPNLKVNWEKAEKLHLTLKFLGDTEKKLN
jgi:2'-5' RNA ligase